MYSCEAFSYGVERYLFERFATQDVSFVISSRSLLTDCGSMFVWAMSSGRDTACRTRSIPLADGKYIWDWQVVTKETAEMLCSVNITDGFSGKFLPAVIELSANLKELFAFEAIKKNSS